MRKQSDYPKKYWTVATSVFPVSLLLALAMGSCNSGSGSAQKDDSTSAYYTMEDFATVKKFDVHMHINTTETAFISQAKADNFRFLDIVDDRPFGIPMAAQQKIADQQQHTFPDRMAVATTFQVDHWDHPDWQKNTIAYLEKQFSNGSKAVKIWKNIGLDLRDKNGKFVMVDDPQLDNIFDYLAEHHIPVIGHNGEPKDCWLPLEKMTFSKGYYSEHPEYHMYLHPEYPSYDDQIRARDHMLEKHPDLAFIGAHLGSLEWSLDELAKRLDKFPNMLVDLSRMPYLQLHAKNDWQKTRNFFIKYQDRLVYGTDRAINESTDTVALKKNIHDGWVRDWNFYTSNDSIALKGFGELKGLHLPSQVIDKIYLKNVDRWLSGVADNHL